MAWTTFAFGGVYPAALPVPALACAALAAAWRPRILARGPAAAVDRLLLLTLAAAALQLAPVPLPVVEAISPSALVVARTISLIPPAGPRPTSVNVEATAFAWLVLAGSILLFAVAREVFSRGGIRTTARALAVTGVALAALAIAQDATARGAMYWRWRPMDAAAAPFGPFVNRNHFATWAIMSIALSAGYLLAHASAHQGPSGGASWRRRAAAALDGRTSLLLASMALLVVALTLSLSRSGMAGLAAAALFGALVVWRQAPGSVRSPARHSALRAALVAAAACTAGAILMRVGAATIASRVGAADGAIADRVTIWRNTIPLLEHFWLTGTGIGAFETAMAVFQQSTPGVLFNQAHNHYLQLAAEGGLLVAVPALIALACFLRSAHRSLRQDRSGMFWIRAGAASGLAGVAVQSLWETGLTTPANAALAAVLAAVLIHVPAPPDGPATR